METVITLIAEHDLPPQLVNMVCRIVLPESSVPSVVWLREGKACDIFASVQNISHVRNVVLDCIENLPIDCIVQRSANRRKKLLLADMDSTMVTTETLDDLAEFAGVGPYVAEITARAMNGEIDFKAALFERVMLLKNLPEETLEVVAQQMKLTRGAKALVRTMKRHGAHCVLISGGFSYFTRRVREACGFDRDISNELEILNNCLTGAVLPPIVDRHAKLQKLEEICTELKIDVTDAATIGDGANDIPMLQGAGLGVAYRGKQVVQNAVPHQLNYSDLTGLLYAQGYFYKEFAE